MADGTASFAVGEKGFRLPHALSPYHWIYLVKNTLSKRVTRTVLCSVCVFELLLLTVWIGVFIRYQELGGNGMLFHSWVWWLAFSILRVLVRMAGTVVIWQRNPDRVRIYFLLYLSSWFLGLFIFTPIFNTTCRCDRFLQCYALKAFEDPVQPLKNTLPPPTWEWAQYLQTPMRVQEFPSREKPLTLAMASQINPPKGGPAVLAELGEDDALHHLLRSNVSHCRSFASTARVDASGDDMTGWTKRHKAALRINSWWKTNAWRRSPVRDRAMLGMFYISPKAFQWIVPPGEADNAVCHEGTKDVSSLEALALQSKWDDLRDAKNLGCTGAIDVGREEVVSFLEECFDDKDCLVVRAQVDWTPQGPQMLLCRRGGNLQLRNGLSPDEAKTTYFIEFRKEDPNRDLKSKGKAAIYGLNSEQLGATENMKRIEGAIDRGCFCDTQRSGCKAAGNVEDERFWCWIKPASAEQCVKQGITVYEANRGKDNAGKEVGSEYWTEDLCNPPQTTCQCTKLGMYPRDEWQLNHRFKTGGDAPGAVWENKMNFGASCETWRETDKMKWCFVGFDSNCADKFGRIPTDHYTIELDGALKGMPLQFKSSLPCDEAAQETAYDMAIIYCFMIGYFMVFLFGLETAVKIPMTFMLHTYLAQRCCDQMTVQEQFDVTFSDEGDLFEEVEENGEGKSAAGNTGGAEDAGSDHD